MATQQIEQTIQLSEMNEITINTIEFEHTFKPRMNHFKSYETIEFECEDKQLEYIKQQPQNHIWTIIENNGDFDIISGAEYGKEYYVYGYIITEMPIPEHYRFCVPHHKFSLSFEAEELYSLSIDKQMDMDSFQAEECLRKWNEDVVEHLTVYFSKKLDEWEARNDA